MALSPGIIQSIIGGATELAGSFVGFGASVYAVNHTPIPAADQYNYNIVLPEPKSKSVITPEVIGLIVVMLIVLLIGVIVVYKIT